MKNEEPQITIIDDVTVNITKLNWPRVNTKTSDSNDEDDDGGGVVRDDTEEGGILAQTQHHFYPHHITTSFTTKEAEDVNVIQGGKKQHRYVKVNLRTNEEME